jgi:MoxR-like ATPase
MTDVKLAAESIRLAVAEACRGLVQRETLVELVVLCAAAREHMLVIGAPGTAKSEAVRRIARRAARRMRFAPWRVSLRSPII